MSPERKIHSLEHLLSLRAQARATGRTVVHCHGCFDIVHPGHIQHLQYARSLGDALIVSVSADTHVAKGVDRPLIPDDLRAASLAALECVDWVYVNPDPTAAELLEQLRPDVLVMDLRLPKLKDGLSLIRCVGEYHLAAKIIVLSGWTEELCDLPEERLVCRVLGKPIRNDDLLEAISAAVSSPAHNLP